MAGAESSERKQAYFNKLVKLLDEYPKIFIVIADNVGSAHMQSIRKALRGKAVVLMGKNTMIRKAIRGHLQNNASLEALLPAIKGNIGFIFTKGDLADVKKVIVENKVSAPAKAGAIAPCDVVVPAGNTGLEPTQTSFLQALNIPSKITRGQIEITNDIPLIKEGNKVGASESNLLAKLNIRPFKYGLKIKTVYDNGSMYDAKVLDLTDDDIISKFKNGVRNVASVSLAVGYPTLASLPHSLARGYKNLLSIAVATDFTFPNAEKVKKYLANPGAFAAAAPATSAKEDKKAPAKEEKKKEEPKEEEEEEDMGLGLFD
jgi:large subunit ribosomal protein LP0